MKLLAVTQRVDKVKDRIETRDCLDQRLSEFLLESGYLYVGSPIEKKRPLNDKEMAFLSASAENYVRLKDEYIIDVKPIS